MVTAAQWARGAWPFVVVQIGWSNTRSGWVAGVTRASTWPGIRSSERCLCATDCARREYAHRSFATWVAPFLTKALPTLERLASRGVDPLAQLRVLAWLASAAPSRRQLLDRTRSAKRLRAEAATLDAALAILRRHHPSLEYRTPMAEVQGEGGPYGRRLYAWTQETLAWSAAMLRDVTPSSGRLRETEALVAALALQRLGCQVVEVGALLVAAGLKGAGESGEDRMKSLLRRARNAKGVVAAVEKLVAPGGNGGRALPDSASHRSRK
jgi:hypothetical protein